MIEIGENRIQRSIKNFEKLEFYNILGILLITAAMAFQNSTYF